MKSILLSVKPQWIAKILNGEKTIEVRKKFPKDYVGWVYMYCSKSGGTLCQSYSPNNTMRYVVIKEKYDDVITNGHIVARFWCDKVEEVFTPTYITEDDNYYSCDNIYELLRESCLTEEQLFDYIGEDNYHFFAIHISKLEIFDRPRELNSFKRWEAVGVDVVPDLSGCSVDGYKFAPHYDYVPLTKAPQNYCYIEGE